MTTDQKAGRPEQEDASMGMGAAKVTFFELHGAKNLALSMLAEASRSLESDPDLDTEEGRATHHWITQGNSGALSFFRCMEILDIEVGDRVRDYVLESPGQFRKAIESVVKSVRSGRNDSSADADDAKSAPDFQGLGMMYQSQDNSVDLLIPQGAAEDADRYQSMEMRGA